MRTLHMLHSLDIAVMDYGTTVRKGSKWEDLAPNEQFELCVCTRNPETHDVKGIGRAVALWYGQFREIPARMLVNEHEIASRDYWGLFDSMRRAYGDDFNEADAVTVIEYQRMS